MDSHGRRNSDKMKRKVGKSKQDGVGRDNARKVQNYQDEVSSLKTDELPQIIEGSLPTCQVILTCCDGVSPPDRSFVDENNSQCGDSSNRKSLLRRGRVESGLTNTRVLKTPSKRFSRKHASDDSISTPVGIKQHICELCSKSFGLQHHLKRHLQTHTGERPHKCELCSKSFGGLENLQTHIHTHTGERPYKCKLCSKSFGYAGVLKLHFRTHTRERPYICQVCSKSFAHKGDLEKHTRTHTGERPYQCPSCSISFGDKSDLTKNHAIGKCEKTSPNSYSLSYASNKK